MTADDVAIVESSAVIDRRYSYYWFLRAPPAPGPPLSGDPAKTFLPSGSVIFPAFTVFVPSLARQPSTETMSPVFVRVHPLELRDLAFEVDRLRSIVLRGKRMVRQDRNGSQQNQSDAR